MVEDLDNGTCDAWPIIRRFGPVYTVTFHSQFSRPFYVYSKSVNVVSVNLSVDYPVQA